MAELCPGSEEQENSTQLDQTRAEIKELRSKIQALKKSVPKGDKKRKKEVSAEVAKLELQLKKLEVNKASCDVQTSDLVQEQLGKVSIDDQTSTEGQGAGKRKNKAKKRREKKSQEDREREERIANSEAEAALNNPRVIERERLEDILGPLGLVVKDVPPDGNCLYAAFSDQLSCRVGVKVSIPQLRGACAQYIRGNCDDFMPFLVDPNTGGEYTKGQFAEYCNEIEHTAAWGGQLEIRALSNVYKVPVTVYQANSSPLILGEEYTNSILTLTYHHHEYGLGEHYNSVVPRTSE